MDTRGTTDIRQILEEIKPETVLLVDLKNQDWFDSIKTAHGNWVFDFITDATDIIKQIERHGRHDVAVIHNTLEYLEQHEAEIVLSRLRDLYAKRILALITIDNENPAYASHWKDSNLIALGLTLLSTYADNKHLYEFNILSYKSVPDWLNAKDWANPELWDKYRW